MTSNHEYISISVHMFNIHSVGDFHGQRMFHGSILTRSIDVYTCCIELISKGVNLDYIYSYAHTVFVFTYTDVDMKVCLQCLKYTWLYP